MADSGSRPQITIQRHYTSSIMQDPFGDTTWSRRTALVQKPSGETVFRMDDIEAPNSWSQLAVDIAASKYFRKDGVGGRGEGHSETSVRQIVWRVAATIRDEGFKEGYFASKLDADAFCDELAYMLVNQIGAFNSPVWFNCGLYHEYGIEGTGGNFAWNMDTGGVDLIAHSYTRPQCSACFLLSVGDSIEDIFELVKTETRLFKYGSGAGANYSPLRGNREKLTGGGTSSGLIAFLRVGDRAAGSLKSGGTTRRAAKMVCLDMDHPEIVPFIRWKVLEEKKAQALIAAGYPSDFNGEAYDTISGQNSNNSVRVTDEFMKSVETDGEWQTKFRTTGEVGDTYKARDLWRMIAESAWACADPGVQYDTTTNAWHTVPNNGPIRTSNPCGEFVHADDTACNLASLNLTKFLVNDPDPGLCFDTNAFDHAVRIFLIAQEILVDLSSYPTAKVAENSHNLRPLGLGYANLGTLLMRYGLPYDSDDGRAMASAITSEMTAHAYLVSAELAATKGAFAGFALNRTEMLRVIAAHRNEAVSHAKNKRASVSEVNRILDRAADRWESALREGEIHGYRNAQATLLAPTGTIGLMMDCDTTGVEPDFALVKFKKLAGGGTMRIVNESLLSALEQLGYVKHERQEILRHVVGTGNVSARLIKRLDAHIDAETISAMKQAMMRSSSFKEAFSAEVLGEQKAASVASALSASGLTTEEIHAEEKLSLGHMTVEGAPHLKQEHYAVFDCASQCGNGTRFLSPRSHLLMMAAVQPFLSGAISKTVNVPNSSTVEDIEKIYWEGWKLGLKSVALYRDGCKASQPLQTAASSKKDDAPPPVAPTPAQAPAAPATINVPVHATRVRLPTRRSGFTQEARVGGHKLFLRTGEYADGQIGEIFVDMHKEGAAFRSLMNCFCIAVSMGLQNGIRVNDFVEQFTFTRFEPQGSVECDPNIKFATSIVDYVFRVVGVHYANRLELAHVAPEAVAAKREAPEDAKKLAKSISDSPVCPACGGSTKRTGACSVCLACGLSLGCS